MTDIINNSDNSESLYQYLYDNYYRVTIISLDIEEAVDVEPYIIDDIINQYQLSYYTSAYSDVYQHGDIYLYTGSQQPSDTPLCAITKRGAGQLFPGYDDWPETVVWEAHFATKSSAAKFKLAHS